MDAFFASVEQLDNPELRGKPIAVGGSAKRGVVAAASYEARKYGVRSAMPSVTAKRLCPNLIFVKHRFERYKEISRQVKAIFFEYTDLVEPLSIDEAFLDVTENKVHINSGTIIAQQIRQKIFAQTQLTASAGVSYNKFLAKIASDINKPNGIKVIPPEEADKFIEALNIKKFFGVGKVTLDKMNRMGIYNGADLKRFSKIELTQSFGKAGIHFYNIVRGIDNRSVNPNRIRKSIGSERTFSDDISSITVMEEKLKPLVEGIHRYMVQNDNFGRTITLKIKSADFVTMTRSRTFQSEVKALAVLQSTVKELLYNEKANLSAVRLLGVAVSNLHREQNLEGIQLVIPFEE